MAKPSLIKLEFMSIPVTHFGAFWMFCEEHPGIQFKHQTPAQSQLPVSKRANGKASEGTTGKCVVLAALSNQAHLTTAQLTTMIVQHGKSPKSMGSLLNELKTKKRIRSSKAGYSITALGRSYLKDNCPNKAKNGS